jgi:hypothetical protein
MTSKILRVFVFGFYIFLSLGFRTFDDKKTFAVDNSAPAKTKIFVDYDQASLTLVDDMPGDDPLSSTSPITVTAAMNSVFNDYNSINAAYVQLVDISDSDYAAESTNRVITIRRGATDGLSGGEAKLEFDGTTIKGCKIDIKPSMYDKARTFVSVITHEIGHCLGLDHPQDTVNAVMSYFNNGISRLQIDDKMGIIYLYPTDPSKAEEKPTFGMSCSRDK